LDLTRLIVLRGDPDPQGTGWQDLRKFVTPLDQEKALSKIFLQSKTQDLALRLQAIPVTMMQGICPAGVAVKQGEGGAGNRFGHSQQGGHGLHEMCLSGPEGSLKANGTSFPHEGSKREASSLVSSKDWTTAEPSDVTALSVAIACVF
jgi:hypothetical protein